VYSLGALLYELLTGRPPFDSQKLLGSGVDEMRRVIREVEPPRPSTRITTMGADSPANSQHHMTPPARLASILRGDLDWVVMKALEKDRSRRYDSANSLALDVGRFLSGEPVLARPPGVAYRMGKFIRKNKGAVATAAILMVTLVTAVVLTTRAWLREKTALENEVLLRKQSEVAKVSALAESERNAQTAGFLDALFSGIRPEEVQGEDITLVKKVLDSSAGKINARLQNQPVVVANLHRIIGKAYRRLGLSAEERSGEPKRPGQSTQSAVGPKKPQPP